MTGKAAERQCPATTADDITAWAEPAERGG